MQEITTAYKTRPGDRYDGRLLRSLDPFTRIIPYIMKTRSGSQNLFSDHIDVSEAEKYIHHMRAKGFKNFGMLTVFISAYVRTVAKYPGINRFVSGQKLYARDRIVISLTVKKQMTLDGTETVVKADFSPFDTAELVYMRLMREIDEARREGDSTGTDFAAAFFNCLPGLFLKGAIAFVSFLDYFGVMPRWIESASPFHAGLFITNLASLGIPPVYHHLYDFGNTPVFLAFGAKRRERILTAENTAMDRRVIDYNVTLDERICDGHYFASAFKYFRNMLKNPWLLDTPPENVAEDIR